MTIKEILESLERAYCGTVGVEYMHIQSRTKCNWLRERIENRHAYLLKNEEKLVAYDRLAWATHFEKFLGIKFSDKRFGCDGGEVMIPGLKFSSMMLENTVFKILFSEWHTEDVMRKPLEHIFHSFLQSYLFLIME